MGLSFLGRRGAPVAAASAPSDDLPLEPLAIGASGVDVTSCPVCARPIAVGTGRCPGCGTHLMLGVPARRAGMFVILGAALGLVFGTIAATLMLRTLPSGLVAGPAPTVAATAPAGSAAPSVSVSVAPTAPVVGIDSQAAAAVGQAVVVNQRLSAMASQLRAQLAAATLDTFAVATTLRALSADAVSARDTVALMQRWPAATDAATSLWAYYTKVRDTAATALAASLSDTSAYRTGAKSMLKVLGSLSSLQSRTVALALEAGVAVPTPTPTPTPAPTAGTSAKP